VAIHELDAPVLSGRERPQKRGRVMRVLYRLFRFQPVVPGRALKDGDTIGGFRVWGSLPVFAGWFAAGLGGVMVVGYLAAGDMPPFVAYLPTGLLGIVLLLTPA
jgi:hypothetical protein